MIDLGTLGGSESEGFGVNAAGQEVGQARTADGHWHAFLWRDGQMTDLGTLGGAFSRASAINAAGEVVGNADTADGGFHAMLWSLS